MNPTTLSTERLYYSNSYQFETEAQIIDCQSDEQGDYVVFDKTLFHPQGGGQPSDKGVFSIGSAVFTVIKLVEERGINFPIKHYYTAQSNENVSIQVGQNVHQSINSADRILFARLHSAGHLFANVVNQLDSEIDGTRGNHFPNQSFVVLSKVGGKVENLTPKQKEDILIAMNAVIEANRPVQILFNDGVRSIQIEGFKAFPCGGTHVNTTGEIGKFTMRSFKREKNDIKIGYDVD